jgi:hypothetical protein
MNRKRMLGTAIVIGFGALIFYLGYWHTESDDCMETYDSLFFNGTSVHKWSDYENCLRAKGLPVLEDLKAPTFDFVEEPRQ